MKTTLISLLSLLFVLPDPCAAKAERQYAYIVVPYINILKERRPEAGVILTAHEGQRFLVKRVGDNWVEVYVPPNNELGWIELGLETPKVEIRAASDMSPFLRGTLFGFAIVIVLAAAILLIIRFLREVRHKKAMSAIGHNPQE